MVGIDEDTIDRRHPNGRKKKRDLLHDLDGCRVVIVGDYGAYSGALSVLPDNRIFIDDTQFSIAMVKRIHLKLSQVDLYPRSTY